MPGMRSPAALFLTVLAVVGPVGPVARPSTVFAAAASIPSREQELAAIRAEITGLQGRLTEVRKRENDLVSRLEGLDLEVRLQERRVAEATTARDLAAARATAAETAVEDLVARLAEVEEDLRQRLASLYRLGGEGYVRLLLSAEPGSDVLSAVRTIRFLARRDRETLDRYQAVQADLARERDELVARLAEVEEWTRTEEGRRRELLTAQRRQRELLAEAEAERRALAERAVELADKERKLSTLLDGLYGRGEAPLAGTPLQDFRGVLDWPIRGEVAIAFGPRLDPRYRTRVPHNGIEIVTEPGAEVRAVYPGKVLFAAPFQGYGPTAVVHHAGRVFTLYAGFDHLGVAAEDMLSLGQVLGTASDRLYFEIRVENKPEDPLGWLR